MVAFNPAVPQGRDDMPNWQKSVGGPISDLQADKSAGLALTGAAADIESGVGIAKQVTSDVINKDVRDTVEPIRENFTKELELARNVQQGNTIPAPVQTPDGSMTLTPKETQPVPEAINSGISKVNALQSALANGKINDTYYDLRLKAAVTDLRSRYPGFVDEIDQKVAQITGVNPANAYIQNLMQDINARQTQKKTATDKAIDDAMKSGYPHSDEMVNQLRERGDQFLPQFQQWYSEQTMFDAQVKRREALRKDMQGTKEDITTQRTADWTNEVGSAVSSNLGTMVKIAGLDKPQSIISMIESGASNPDQYTEAQYKQLGTQLLAQKAVLERQLTARLNQTNKDNRGTTYSYASDVGAQKAQEIIKSQIAIYDTMANALINNKDAGLAFYAANHAQAILDQSKDNLVSDQTVGAYSAKMAQFNTLFGPNWTSLSIRQALRKDMDTKLGAYLDNDVLDARLGTGVTMKEHLDKAQKLQEADKITAARRSKYINNLVGIVDDLKNPDAPIQDKINVAKYIFSPEGQGILSHIKTEYKDPNTGKLVPGKYSAFTRLTSDDVVKEIKKMPSEIQQQYKSYMEREAGSQLFYKELLNLNHFTGHDDLHFKYDDGSNGGTPHIELIPPDNKPKPGPGGLAPTPPPSSGYLFQVNQIVNRINDGLSGMGRVEKGLGGNASEYLLQFMMRSQVDLGKNWEGLPAKLIDAIAASRAPARRIEDTFEDAGKKR